MEPSQSQAANNTAKPQMTSFFPSWRLKGTQPALKTPTVHLAHLEEDSAEKEEEVESEDPNGINGVMEESCEGCPSRREALLSL